MASKEHWEKVYSTKATDSVSWFQPRADLSLELIKSTGAACDAGIIDVGGGASTLVDDLVAEGYSDLTVLDLSGAALNAARKRLGKQEGDVRWIEADITSMSGMRRSMITTSGRRLSVNATADAPSVASPITRIRGERESARRKP